MPPATAIPAAAAAADAWCCSGGGAVAPPPPPAGLELARDEELAVRSFDHTGLDSSFSGPVVPLPQSLAEMDVISSAV